MQEALKHLRFQPLVEKQTESLTALSDTLSQIPEESQAPGWLLGAYWDETRTRQIQ